MFSAVIHTQWLDLWRFAVQVSIVQSFHLTLLISQPRLHFLPGHGSGQVLTLTDQNKQREEIKVPPSRGSGLM